MCGVCLPCRTASRCPSACLGNGSLGDRFGTDHQITGIRHHWTFDEFYTAMAIQGLDANGDGIYSKEELEPLAKVNVELLKEFDYFTFVHLSDDDKSLPLKEPVGYSVDYDKTLLTLHFTLSPARWRSTATSMK